VRGGRITIALYYDLSIAIPCSAVYYFLLLSFINSFSRSLLKLITYISQGQGGGHYSPCFKSTPCSLACFSELSKRRWMKYVLRAESETETLSRDLHVAQMRINF
jgi:hypothetical protein